MKLKQLILPVSLASTAMLSACHDNPLKTEPRKSTMVFLQQAAMFAESKMHLPKRSVGSYYQRCMTESTQPINCDQYFKEMLAFAKSNSIFKTLTYHELSDRKTYALFDEDYRAQLFNTLPTDED